MVRTHRRGYWSHRAATARVVHATIRLSVIADAGTL